MNKLERTYALDRLLTSRRTALPMRTITERLECSEATVRRLFGTLRDRYGAPLAYDREARGWRYDTREGDRPYQLPGLWFSETELYALLAAHQLLAEIPPGLLQGEVAPLTDRIQGILHRRGLNRDQLARRVRLIPIGARRLHLAAFGTLAAALIERRRLRIRYRPRGRTPGDGEAGGRDISPQRLTWYRSNWYLDAWCHRAEGFRRFACERIDDPCPLDTAARDCTDAELDAYFADAYGIFAGPAPKTAVLRFSPERARWVAEEQWHPRQQGSFLPDGRYELRLPYGAEPELLMDILRHGPQVEVVAPPELRQATRDLLAQALARYA